MRLDLKLVRFSAALSSGVLTTGALTYGGYWLGRKLDSAWNSSPLWSIGLLLVGVCIGLGYLIYISQKLRP